MTTPRKYTPAQREDNTQREKNYRMHGGNATPRGTARAKRRFNGDYAPVNKEASLAQHPDARYAKSLYKPKTKSVEVVA